MSRAGYYDITCPRAAFGEPEPVTYATSQSQRRAVAQFACYFRREFQYDFVQYEASEGRPWDRTSAPENDEAAPYLLRSLWRDPALYVGAACFRWRVYRDHPATWALAWIWLHPYERRQGIVTAAWPGWLDQHGAFLVEPPLSDAMRGFLARPAIQAARAAVVDYDEAEHLRWAASSVMGRALP